jgi:O-antigen ligase/polysaccharide polymerase Wzy-like membrane protein
MNGRMPATIGNVRAEAGDGPLGSPLAQRWSLPLVWERLGPVLAGSVLPFGLVVYLALKGGGYDGIVYGEVGVAVWWIVLLGAAVGVLPRVRVTSVGWIGVALLGAFAAWTALGIGWSESAERSVAEVGRVAMYLGVFALALLAQGRDGLRRTVNALAAAIAVVAGLALLSRLHPSWFPANDTARFLPETRARLNYPLNYWNGLAALIAVGIPLVLVAATRSRRIAAQALAAAALPAMALAGFYTASRGGALEVAIALIVLLALYPRRLQMLPTLGLGAAGSAILIAAATQRDALDSGLLTEAARSQGNEMLAMAIVVCAGVALLQVAIGLVARHEMGPRVAISRWQAASALAATVAVGLTVAIAAGLPGYLSDRWQEFKQPVGVETNTAERFSSASGNGRYQYWQSALDANATDPLKGTGPDTFEYWWAEHGTLGGFIRDTHSLYFQTLAETGIVGLLFVGGMITFVLFAGTGLALRAGPETRGLLAGATAACAAFAAAGAVDWVWQLPVIPVVFLLLCAAILGPSARSKRSSAQPDERRPIVSRAVLVPLALASLVAIAIPLAATARVRESQQDARASQLAPALDRARDAHSIQPYAATPSLQEALVLELQGQFGPAVAAARSATEAEPTNWRTWLVLSRLEAKRGNARESVNAYREARSLNPRSPLFQP